jgi:lipoprotein-anchoring transpeptidase ErfK/SrfK
MQPRYYHSEMTKKQPLKGANHSRFDKDEPKKLPSHRGRRYLLFLACLIVAAIGVNHFVGPSKVEAPALSSKTTHAKVVATTTAPKPVVAAAITPCTGNSLSQLIVVSISERHLYACNAAQQVYDSPVITGISYLAADLTPVGTYHIYAKETDQVLKGCDTTGCWDDNVTYWMPFLDNQYGEYGFHDATWRAPTDFGNISPDSSDASHGCVECPLATAAWLYGWAQVGTTVSIVS